MKVFLLLFICTIMLTALYPQTGTIIINKITNPPTSTLEFNYINSPIVTITSPFIQQLTGGWAVFGPVLNATGVTGNLQLINNEGCNASDYAGFTPGNIAVIERSDCLFTDKTINAQNAGAIAVIIMNNVAGGEAISLGGTNPAVTIPAVSVSYEDGLLLKALIGSGVTARIHKQIPDFTLLHGDSMIITDVPAGTYVINERPPQLEGLVLSDILITDLSGGSTKDLYYRRVSIQLNPGETVECTFITDIGIIDSLAGDVTELLTSGVLNKGNANALLSKLETAKTKLAEGNTNAAVNILKAFINQVQEFISNGILTASVGQALIDEANEFITLIGSGLPKEIARELTGEVPEYYSLMQNYPNPFNPATTISWYSPVESWQTIKVYGILGNEIVTLVDEYRNAGYNSVNFDASGLPSGMYIYVLKSEGFNFTKKLVLMK